MTARCFFFGTLLDPDVLSTRAPDAVFDRIAHLPGQRLGFTAAGVPVVVSDESHSVWGAVFSVPTGTLAAVADGLEDETVWAVDRDGARFEVTVFTSVDDGAPSEDVVEQMVRGARHWELPAGWVVGLEDLLDPFDF